MHPDDIPKIPQLTLFGLFEVPLWGNGIRPVPKKVLRLHAPGELSADEIHFHSHIINKDGIRTNKEKVKIISEYPHPF